MLRDDAVKLYDISLKNLRELSDGQNILIVILELSKVFFKDSNIILKYSIQIGMSRGFYLCTNLCGVRP